MGKRMETRTQMTPATRLSCSDTGKQQQSLNIHWPPLMMIIMIIVIIISDNVDADDPHLSKAVISIFVQNSMPPFVEFGHKILSQLNFGINVVDKWCLVSITCVAVSLMGFSLNQQAVLMFSLSWAPHFVLGNRYRNMMRK